MEMSFNVVQKAFEWTRCHFHTLKKWTLISQPFNTRFKIYTRHFSVSKLLKVRKLSHNP
uniref:Uncharacterized protein n=1 Tax=Rhizophora mucronata TaxID=61149 RepID=A0A2P2Q699_RHIMU